MREYSDTELSKLHDTLFDILEEIIRVCDILHIEYFAIGGTGIGVHFWQDIIPWDDDIDIGMTRNNYNRFLKEAPAVLRPEFFLAWYGTDPHTPFYFAKLRKKDTLFVEELCRDINMNHGIFVDIFPFDKVPRSAFLERMQRKAVNRINECFVGKEVWPWQYFGTCALDKPNAKGWLGCLLTRIVTKTLSKRAIYKTMCRFMTLFDRCDADYYNHIVTSFDHIPLEDLHNMQKKKFGRLEVAVPDHLDKYLFHHYGPGLKKIPAKEIQVNHAPLTLKF